MLRINSSETKYIRFKMDLLPPSSVSKQKFRLDSTLNRKNIYPELFKSSFPHDKSTTHQDIPYKCNIQIRCINLEMQLANDSVVNLHKFHGQGEMKSGAIPKLPLCNPLRHQSLVDNPIMCFKLNTYVVPRMPWTLERGTVSTYPSILRS